VSKILELSDVRKSYGSLEVLKGVSFSVDAGQIFAIIGPNGAGKTTLFKTMTGESMCDSGQVWYNGENITRMPVARRVHNGMARTFQVARVFRDFTVHQNIVVTIEARLRAAGGKVGPLTAARPSSEVVNEADQWITEMHLDHVRHKEAMLLSHGDKKRLEFLIALVLQPRILMLDEPTAGMSPTDRVKIGELMREVQQKHGITMIMTEHDMDIVFGLAQRVMVLNYGEMIAVGTVDDIRTNSAVADVYLGKEMYSA
jgi:branched-chain amino acid transport system ATP-binding protein